MRVVEAGYEILTEISDGGIKELQHIEKIGRVCYKSEDKITEDGESAKKFVKMLIDRGHEAMIEHSSLAVKFIVDRGVSHELVRHRIASFAQESTRYCNYAKDKFGNEVTFIKPFFFDEPSTQYGLWKRAMEEAECNYLHLLESGASPQEARSVLPNSTKTEITITANYREWRNFFKLRAAESAHPQMREVTVPLLIELSNKLPVIFEDLAYKYFWKKEFEDEEVVEQVAWDSSIIEKMIENINLEKYERLRNEIVKRGVAYGKKVSERAELMMESLFMKYCKEAGIDEQGAEKGVSEEKS